MVSVAIEDYLRAVFVLEERKVNVKSKDLSEYLGVSKNTVSQMLYKMSSEGLVVFKKYSRNIKLSKKGLALAKNLTFKHRLIEKFLVDVLKRSPEKVHFEAHKLEHAFSNESIKAMEKLLGNPALDPHGREIPKI